MPKNTCTLLAILSLMASMPALADKEGDHDGWRDGGAHFRAPEIDPASSITALTLLAGGIVLIRGRKRRRDQ